MNTIKHSKMNMLLRYTSLACVALVVTGCKPLPLYFEGPKTGPEEYRKGWDDGCDSGVAAGGTLWQKIMYNFSKDPNMLENAHYKQGWNEGFSYCRFYNASYDK